MQVWRPGEARKMMRTEEGNYSKDGKQSGKSKHTVVSDETRQRMCGDGWVFNRVSNEPEQVQQVIIRVRLDEWVEL